MNNSVAPKTIAFDLGGVIFDFDYYKALKKLKGTLKTSHEQIAYDLFHNHLSSDFEKGTINSLSFYQEFKRRYHLQMGFEEFTPLWSDIFTLKEEVIELIQRLRMLYSLYLISNINELHFHYLFKKYPLVFSLFDGLILSFKEGSVKPEQKIYDVLKVRAQQSYKNIVYIDDRSDLIDEAKKLTLDCIQFTTPRQLASDLTKRNLIIPTAQENTLLKNLKRKLSLYKNPAIVGVGNTLKSDDGVGSKIAQAIKDIIPLRVIDAGVAPENYLSVLRKENHDFLLFIDTGHFSSPSSLALFPPQEIKTIALYSTHNSSLKLAMDYLQKEVLSDILICAIKAQKTTMGGTLSVPVARLYCMMLNFFMRNFSHPIRK